MRLPLKRFAHVKTFVNISECLCVATYIRFACYLYVGEDYQYYRSFELLLSSRNATDFTMVM